MRRFPGPVPVTAMTNQLNPIGEELRILQSQVEVFTPAEVLMLRRRFFPSENIGQSDVVLAAEPICLVHGF